MCNFYPSFDSCVRLYLLNKHLRANFILLLHWALKVGRDSFVGIATRWTVRIESRWGVRFSAPIQTSPGAHPTSYTMGTWSLPGVKRPRRGIDHPPQSIAEAKERVEVCLYSPSGPSWPVLR